MEAVESFSYKAAKKAKRGFAVDDKVHPRRKRSSAELESSQHERPSPKVKKTEVEHKESVDQTIDMDIELLEGDDTVCEKIDMKKMLLAFEKEVLKNQKRRRKFPDRPEKYMNSEIRLDNILLEMQRVAAKLELYELLVELNCIPSISGLLAHDNKYISIEVVDFLERMPDIHILRETQVSVESWIDAMLENELIAMLVLNLERLDESIEVEAEGVT